jgi:CDP-2,3-bis-(O-geranylgeranyl)-sn-glycerol synthase
MINFTDILTAAYYAVPIYFANMAPVITKKLLPSLAKPMDLGKTWKGKPILGSHKTFRGLIFGIIFGILTALIQYTLYKNGIFRSVSVFDYTFYSSILLGALMGFGAIFGDALKSFFKRRVNVKPGKPWIPFDEIDFIVGGLSFSMIFFIAPLKYMIIILVVSPLGHIIVNHIAFYLKIRKEKW